MDVADTFSVIDISECMWTTIVDKVTNTEAVFLSFSKNGQKCEMVNTLQRANCKVATFVHAEVRWKAFKFC